MIRTIHQHTNSPLSMNANGCSLERAQLRLTSWNRLELCPEAFRATRNLGSRINHDARVLGDRTNQLTRSSNSEHPLHVPLVHQPRVQLRLALRLFGMRLWWRWNSTTLASIRWLVNNGMDALGWAASGFVPTVTTSMAVLSAVVALALEPG